MTTMVDILMLEFLMEHDVSLVAHDTQNRMTADEAFELGGEYVVYETKTGKKNDLYRGTDFDEALKFLEGKSE